MALASVHFDIFAAVEPSGACSVACFNAVEPDFLEADLPQSCGSAASLLQQAAGRVSAKSRPAVPPETPSRSSADGPHASKADLEGPTSSQRVPLVTGKAAAEEEKPLQEQVWQWRGEDAKLREQNSQLQHQWQEAVMRAVGGNASQRMDAGLPALRLLADGATGRTSSSHLLAARGRSAGLTSLVAVLVIALFFLLCMGLQVYEFLHLEERDLDGDGRVDAQDFAKFVARKIPCCYMSWSTLRRLGLFFLQVLAVGAFLWWRGIIQPVLRSLIVYIYLIICVVWAIYIFGGHGLKSIRGGFAKLKDVMERVESFFDKGFEEMVENCQSCCSCSPKPPPV